MHAPRGFSGRATYLSHTTDVQAYEGNPLEIPAVTFQKEAGFNLAKYKSASLNRDIHSYYKARQQLFTAELTTLLTGDRAYS